VTVDADRWQQVKRLFNDAVLLDGEARTALLAEVRGRAPDLAADVESLLDWDARPGSPLDSGVGAAVAATAPDEDEALLGGELGSWRLVSILGRGGMGIVYRAERADAAFRRPAAVKIVRHGGDSAEILRRFHQERETLAALDHPNIARVFDGGTTPKGRPYLVMELVDGVPIHRYCDERQLSIEQRLALFRQVCTAVQYAHQNLVIHRDIKPDNILVTNDGTPKLLDFGVAKLLTQPEASAVQFAATWLLTPEFASPEQLRGQPVTTATDVYSLGVLLCVLLTGRRPYVLEGTNLRTLQAQLADIALRPASELVAGGGETADLHAFRRKTTPARLAARLRGDLDAILLKALDPDPARRYGTAERLARDLDRHRALRPIEARAASRAYVVGRLVQRHRLAIGVAAAIGVLIVAAVAAIVRQAQVAAEARARAERRFADVRRLAQSFMFDVHDAIVNVPGTTAARGLMVRTTITYLDSLAGEAAGDRELQRELAAAYVRVGDAQGHPTSANLGDTAGARASYQRAIAIADGLLADRRADVEASRTLAMAHRRLADVLAWGGDPASSLPHVERSGALFADLARRRSATVQDRLQAAIGEIKVGDLLGNPNFPNLGRAGEASARYDVALASLRPLAKAAGADQLVRRYLALALERIGTMHESAGRLAEAEAAYRESFAIRETLVAEVKLHVDIQRDFAIAYEKLGNVRLARGDRAGAVENYRGALGQFERLAQADPQNAIAQRSVAIGRERLVDALVAGADKAEAVVHLRAALATYRRLGERDPENAQTQCDRRRVSERLADLLLPPSSVPGSEACALWRESADVAGALRAGTTARCVGPADLERLTSKLRRCA
jgi:non-specific serine/threonine protein kinase/serine/threonine-protein kinase